ncbi:MAG: DNA mismatch repair endonuclease MutL, partial [Anaerolineales bacterium]|nr:DNA mismatch repair endonuclease MutL [Anaerolineales bacterium]
MPIRILSETVAAQIAAGEVVERPASVVKELVENSLDAGASDITIEIREGGRRLIRISDNGCGIAAAEVEIAFHRHSTSKLSSAADLAAIQTLGFRGEALASIASVSQLTMVTRAAGEIAGTRVRIEGGHICSNDMVGSPQGTVIGVENLFYNVPARLEFLRSVGTEKRQINELVTRYALAYPAVRFRLVHDNRMVFQSSGGDSFPAALVEVYGLDTFRQMVELVDDRPESEMDSDEKIRVSGFTSAPSLSRANRNHITLFVNGRWVQDKSLTFAV